MRPTRDEYLMEVAWATAKRSTCKRPGSAPDGVGVVFSVDGRILSTGYNGAPAGMPHCDHSHDGSTSPTDISNWGKYWVNGKWQDTLACLDSVHAEANGIAFAARHGIKLGDSQATCTHSPCPVCAKLLINAGIVRVVYSLEYRLPEGLNLLRKAKIGTDHLVFDTEIGTR